MPPSSAVFVRRLYAACHPGWPMPPSAHFFAYPTIVASENAEILGYASYSMNLTDTGLRQIWLQDSGVAEHARGRGIARELLRYRLDIGRAMSVSHAIGMTQPDNHPMLRLLRTEGFDEVHSYPAAYPDGQAGVLFIRSLEKP